MERIFFIIAFAQQKGTEILQQRIQEQFRRFDKFQRQAWRRKSPTRPSHPGRREGLQDAFVKDLT
jgi:hypothetical protein